MCHPIPASPSNFTDSGVNSSAQSRATKIKSATEGTTHRSQGGFKFFCIRPKNFWNRLPSRESYRWEAGSSKMTQKPRIVIIGAGFGGLNAAQTLAKAAAQIVVIDRKNFHTFQPLLYQVATAGLSPGEIASPIRSILRSHKNIEVFMG